jgi:hypothetical protein
MDNELDTLSNNDIQPYNPGVPGQELAPHNHDQWARNDLDEVRHAPQSQGPTFFGQALPAGTTQAQVEQTLIQLGAVFANEMGSLGYPAAYINATVQFYQTHATKKPYAVTKNHNFTLPAIADDWLGHAFCNMVNNLSGSPRAKQQWITSALTWLAKANQKLNSGSASTSAQGSAPNSTEALLASLSDKDYNAVIKINEQALARAMQILADKHGERTAQSMVELAQKQLESLSPNERAHFEQFTTVNGQSWVSMLNTVEAIEFLYKSHIGAASIGASSGDINKEIAQFEAMLKVPSERARYMRDPAMQARLRELYSRRDGD